MYRYQDGGAVPPMDMGPMDPGMGPMDPMMGPMDPLAAGGDDPQAVAIASVEIARENLQMLPDDALFMALEAFTVEAEQRAGAGAGAGGAPMMGADPMMGDAPMPAAAPAPMPAAPAPAGGLDTLMMG